jgi:D-glycero-D-manno-heptose 1,7-bisphosphate phosphatase
LRREGFLLIVVTNQPDIARGKANRGDVDNINAQLAAILPLDAIEVCEQDDKEQCECRKPKPSVILRGREKLGVDLVGNFLVGDHWRDIEAGRRAGCRAISIGDGYGEFFPSSPTINVASLPEVASWIIKQSRGDPGLYENDQ